MTNVEFRMTEAKLFPLIRISDSFRHSTFVIRLSLVLLWLCGAVALDAASPKAARLAVDPPWTPEKGLPDNTVFSLLQTRDGYLWAGTGYGLARFDGIHFETFDENNTPGLEGSRIIKLFEDSRGNLWIGTDTAILVADPQGKIGRVERTGGQEGLLVTICEDLSGGIWLHTANGLVRRFRDGNTVMTPDLKLEGCGRLAVDNSGIVWVWTLDGWLRSPGQVPSMTIPVGQLDFMLPSKAGGYWRLANGRVLRCRMDRVERDFGRYPWSATITSAIEDQATNLVIGTWSDGVYWLDPAGEFIHLTNFPSTYIFSLCLDREESLWVGTDNGGLNRVRRPGFDVLDKVRDLPTTSVCEDNQGGIWFGINNRGVDYLKDGVVRAYRASEGLSDLYVRGVLADRSGNVWVGTERGGLFRLAGEKFQQVERWSGIAALYQDRQGLLWFGTDQGLHCRDTGKAFTSHDGLCADSVRALADDAAGNLWIGTAAGLNRLHAGQLAAFHKANGLPSEDISSLYVDAENVLWVGTSGGLARFDGTRWARYFKEDGLKSSRVGYLAEDADHYMWIGSPGGLMRVSKNELNQFARGEIRTINCRAYGLEDGLPTGQCLPAWQPAAAVGRDGTLWFSTVKGLVSVRPALLSRNTNPPPVRIESVKVQGQLQNTNNLRALPPAAVTIPPNKEGLEIDYTSLNLSAPEKARFKYRMEIEGHRRETNWIKYGNVRVAQVPTLPPGRHRFQVTACNEDGVWNETGASLAVTVLPPFWRTTGFLTVTTLCLLGVVVGSVYYVSTQRLQRQLAALRQQEALEKERARIARDLHDQLGANLTQVALLGEMVEADKAVPQEVEGHARQISSTARETTRALDEIVWTVNPSNDTLDGLINYICKYAQEYLALAGLRYRLEVPPELPAIPISPELRHNVFLAAKEAINNVVKHSQATSAWLRLRLEPHQFVLEIEDNGRGVSAGDEKKGRSGLRNMRKRMEDIGGQFDAAAGTEDGTRVRLIAPLRRAN